MTRPNFLWSRRSLVRRGVAFSGAGAFFAAGFASGMASAQGAKIAPAVAHYQAIPKGKATCENCSSFVSPSACKVVSGDIAPTGWCMLYAAKR